MYDRTNNIDLPVSASLCNSNLSVVTVNDRLYTGVIHKGEFVIACPSYPDNVIINRVIPKLSPQQIILQATWIWSDNPLLVLTTAVAIQIFDWDGAILLHTHPIPQSSIASDGTSYFRGVVGLPSGRICVGMHSGEMMVLNLKDSSNLAIIEEDRQVWFHRPLAALSSFQSDIVAADDVGHIIIGKDSDTLQKKITIKSHGPAITCLEIHKDHTIAGYTSGHIRIFNNMEGYIVAEVAAHARAITGLDIARTTGMMLSVSEDTFARIWKLDFSVKTFIEHKYSQSETNALLCGGRFTDSAASGYLLTAYDVPSIITYSL